MAVALKKKYGAETELVKGSKGIFDVTLGSKLLFSKHEVGRFPEHSEIFDQVEAKG